MSRSNDKKRLIKIIEQDGWIRVRQKGSHIQYKHPIKKGKVTIPISKGGITRNIELSVLRQAQIEKPTKF